MKAQLEFTLPEEKYDYMCATHGAEYHTILVEFNASLRGLRKYESHPEEAAKLLERVWNMWCGMITDLPLEE